MGFPELATLQVAGLSTCFLAAFPSHINPSRRKTGIIYCLLILPVRGEL